MVAGGEVPGGRGRCRSSRRHTAGGQSRRHTAGGQPSGTVVMGSHRAGSTPARASAQVGDPVRPLVRVIDSTICRPSAAVRSPVNHSPAAFRSCSLASALIAAWSFTAGSGGPGPVGIVVGVMARSCPTTRCCLWGRCGPVGRACPDRLAV